MSHLRLVMRARLDSLNNRFKGRAPSFWIRLAAVVGALAAGLLALGNAAAPGLLAPPADVVTAVGLGGADGELPGGAGALEAAFWLTALASSVLNFRVMELLFRRRDIRAIETYPIDLSALFVDRLLAAGAEAVAAAMVLAPFFVPLMWHGGVVAGATSIALVVIGLLTSSAIGLAVQLGAGSTMAGPAAAESSGGETRDIYGGSGQVFLYSPGIALAVSVIVILLAKLALGEVLKAGHATRALQVGLGVLAVAFATAVGVSWRYFVSAFPRMAARFHEADFVGYEISAKHQQSNFGHPQFGEQLLPAAARPAFRMYALQYGRRFMLSRWSYLLGWLAGGFGVFRLSQAALPGWLVVTLPAVALASVANPWSRLSDRRIRPDYQDVLALSARHDNAAATLFGMRETLLFSTPYALLVLLARGFRAGDWLQGVGWAALAVGGCLALSGAVAALWRAVGRLKLPDLVVPAVVAVGLVALANVSLWALAVAEVILAAANLFAGAADTQSPSRTPQAST